MLRYALPALAAAGAARAQCSVSGTTTIQNGGDATAIASCSTFSGSIAIATNVPDEPITFDSPLARIRGDLVVSSATNLSSISGPALQMIDGELSVTDVQNLDVFSFPQLSACGSITLTALPNLYDMDTAISDTTSVNIQNTALQSLRGLNLEECNSFYIANNNQLQEISLQLANMSGAITVQYNGDRLQVEFPNLEWAQNITFQNVRSISMPSLYAVNGSLGFDENVGLTNLSCPNLARLDESLTIANNDDLESISFPKLEQVGGALNVQNNTELGSIRFPVLTEIGGALDAYGSFSELEIPDINRIRGAVNVQSTEDIQSNVCDKLSGNDAIQGEFECVPGTDDPQGADGQGTGSSSNSRGDNEGAAFQILPHSAWTGIVGVLVTMLVML